MNKIITEVIYYQEVRDRLSPEHCSTSINDTAWTNESLFIVGPSSTELRLEHTITCHRLWWTWLRNCSIIGNSNGARIGPTFYSHAASIIEFKPLDIIWINVIGLVDFRRVKRLSQLSVSKPLWKKEQWSPLFFILDFGLCMLRIGTGLGSLSKYGLIAIVNCTDPVHAKVLFAKSMAIAFEIVTAPKDPTTWTANTKAIANNRMTITWLIYYQLWF